MSLSLRNIVTLFLLTSVLTIGLALAPSAPSYAPTDGESPAVDSTMSSFAQMASVSSAEAADYVGGTSPPVPCIASREGAEWIDDAGNVWECVLAPYSGPYYITTYRWERIN